MCGIFGVISTGKVDPRVCKFFSDAFLAGAVRGVDSVGAFQVDKKRDVYIEKKAIAAADFIELKHTKAIIADVDTCVLTVGHNRAATNGKVIDRNAHPFEIPLEEHTKPLVGVHNGSLNSWLKRDRELADIEEEFEVDSHWALAKISKSLDLKATLEELKGPFVFNWWDPRTKDTCYLARGTGRSVHFCTVKDGSDARYVVWASEAGMLSWLLDRNNLVVSEGKIFEVPENTLVEFSLTKVGEYKTTSFTPKIVPYQSSTTYTNTYNPNSTYSNTNYSEGFVLELQRIIEKAKDSLKTPASKSSNVVTLPTTGKPHIPGHSNVELAKNLNLHGETVVFQADIYDAASRTIYGEALANDAQMTYPAAIHGADAALGEALCLSAWCECDVVAAATTENGVKLILKRPTAVYPGSNPADKEKIDRLLNSRKMGVADETTVH